MNVTWTTREELAHQVVMLARAGSSSRSIARALGVGRNTVKALLAAHKLDRDRGHVALKPRPARAPRAAKIDAYKPRIAALMTEFPDITAQRVFEVLRDEGFEGGYTGVKRYVRSVRPKPKPTPSLTTPEYAPGQMSESDWSSYEVRFTTGVSTLVQAFSYVLVTSTRKHFELYESNDLHALMDGHECAFNRLGAYAHECKYDSQKPVVLRWEANQPIYNPRFLAFSTHYEFRPVAVRRGHPNDKPRTERSFWEVERSFLNGRKFRDLDDMRKQLADWLERIVDHRKRHGKTALERFADERPHLVSPPRRPYDTARVIYRICSIDGFVAWAGNHYAIPYEHVTDILPVRITQRELFVYAPDLRCIARHELAPRGAGARLDPARLHRPARGKSPIDLDQLRLAYERMGARAAEFFRLMSLGPARAWSSQARRILLLRERFGTDELEQALGYAARFGALEHAAIESILSARAKPRTLDEYVAEDTARRLEEALGDSGTEPRDLTEYDRMPIASALREKESTPWIQQATATTTTDSSANDSGGTSSCSD